MTARQIKSAYLTGRITFRAAHTMLRANGYSDSEADDILWDIDEMQRRDQAGPTTDPR